MTRLLLVLLSACSSTQMVGGNCSYEELHGTCRFVALERGAPGQAWAFYDFNGTGQLGIELAVDEHRLADLEAHLRDNAALPCAGERIVRGTCVPMRGVVAIPSFEGATTRR